MLVLRTSMGFSLGSSSMSSWKKRSFRAGLSCSFTPSSGCEKAMLNTEDSAFHYQLIWDTTVLLFGPYYSGRTINWELSMICGLPLSTNWESLRTNCNMETTMGFEHCSHASRVCIPRGIPRGPHHWVWVKETLILKMSEGFLTDRYGHFNRIGPGTHTHRYTWHLHLCHYVHLYGGFHGHGGTLKQMVYWLENPIYKWMMTGGPPMAMATSI